MKVAVISDTHEYVPSNQLASLYEKELAPADALLHLGDVTGEPTLALFMNHPCFFGVAGNMDGPGVTNHLPGLRKVELEGFSIGMAHGWGFGGDMALSLINHFGPDVDIVCFGHSHVFQWTQHNGVWALNPGSVGSPRKGGPSMAFLHLEQGQPPHAEQMDLSWLW